MPRRTPFYARAVLYADVITDSMRRAIDEPTAAAPFRSSTTRQRITPQSIVKPIDLSLIAIAEADYSPSLSKPKNTAAMTADHARNISSSSRSACVKRPRNSNSSSRAN